MIVDTGALIALFIDTEQLHEPVVRAVTEHSEANPRDLLVVSPLSIAELDHIIATRHGSLAALAVVEQLASGAWEIASFSHEDLAACAGVMRKYGDLRVGATDASLVVLADRYRTHTIATLDRRHFGAMRALDGKPFELLAT